MVADDVVLSRLDHLRSVLNELEQVRPPDLESLLDSTHTASRRATERCLYLAIQEVLDIATHIATAEGWGCPTTYREAVEKLGERGVVPPNFARLLAGMAGFRNILEHDYVRLDPERLLDYAYREQDFLDFAEYVVAYVRR